MRKAIEQIVIRIEVSLRMRAGIFIAFVRAGQRTFKHIAKIKDVITAREHGMRDVFMHRAKTGAIIKVFTRGMCLRIHVVDQPWRREDPVLESFIVIAVL